MRAPGAAGRRNDPPSPGSSSLAEVFGTGSIESRRTVDLGFDVPGRVARIEVDQGDAVRAGQDLAALDAETFRAAAAVAREELKVADAARERLLTEVTRGEAELEGAEANLRRVRDLRAKNLVSPEELDVAEEREKVAAADLARAKAARVEGEGRLAAAGRALERAEADLARTVAKSPFQGLVLRREREVGDVAAPGAPVLRLAATDVVWASVWVDETSLDLLREGEPARVHLRSAPERALAGKVARIGREVDRETRELLVDVAIEPLPERLAIGQRADLWIEVARRADGVRIPPEFVAWSEGRGGAFVLDGSRARFGRFASGRAGASGSRSRRGSARAKWSCGPSSPGRRRSRTAHA